MAPKPYYVVRAGSGYVTASKLFLLLRGFEQSWRFATAGAALDAFLRLCGQQPKEPFELCRVTPGDKTTTWLIRSEKHGRTCYVEAFTHRGFSYDNERGRARRFTSAASALEVLAVRCRNFAELRDEETFSVERCVDSSPTIEVVA